MEIFRLRYDELPQPSKELLAFMAEYFNEHDTGDEGIIARVDTETVADMMLFFESEDDPRIKELEDWWLQFSQEDRENGGFDIQILTGK